MLRLIVGICWFLVGPLSSGADEIIAANRAHEFAGKIITVEGTVVTAHNEGRNTFLSLSSSTAPEFSVAITPPLLLSGFPPQPERFYQGKKIRVNGTVYLLRGQPEMLVSDVERITVVGETEPAGIREALRPQQDTPVGRPSAALSFPPLPRELVTGTETKLLDLRSSPMPLPGTQTVQASTPCDEAQTLWRQVTQDLVPHLRTYTSCLEKGSLGCDPEGEKVALGMLAVQQAQKRVRMTCR
jgi:hypothetical protein